MVLFTLMTLCSYPMGHNSSSSKTKNGKKSSKNVFLVIFASITSYSTYKFFYRPLYGVQLSYDIPHGAFTLI
jgi:cellobiose-specific phosphotransferase system component IIC